MREAAKRPVVTLEELQRSAAQVRESVHRTTISRALHKSGFHVRVVRRKPLLTQKQLEVPCTVCYKPCRGHNKHLEEGALVR